jgi:hypothetical protein
LSILLLALALPFFAQVNGDLQYIGDKAILHVWGTHYDRGYAQGYLLAGPILAVFNDFYYVMFSFSNPAHYAYLGDYYQQHFYNDANISVEAEGIIAGIQASGTSLYHAGLQRDLTAADILQANAFLDMLQVRNRIGDNGLRMGCASLSSWGSSTEQDSLLAGSSVITRWLDWTEIDVLIDNPLLIVHHPSEPDEQEWLTVTVPGWLGAPSSISVEGTWASLNMGNDHSVTDPNNLDPILYDVRRGQERIDYNADGEANALDVSAAVQGGHHLNGTIIHVLSEEGQDIIPVVVETNNSGTALRYYDHPESGLPGHNLAATNHFRALTFPSCCSRYANIIDSLNANPNITAKRQWNLLAGAAGQETTLAALQYVPSTGTLIWSGATSDLPAYMNPGLTLSVQNLFDFSTPADDPVYNIPVPALDVYPNPLFGVADLSLKGGFAFDTMSVYNLRGQKVYSSRMPSARTEVSIALPELNPGLYLVRVSNQDGRSTVRKLVIGF